MSDHTTGPAAPLPGLTPPEQANKAQYDAYMLRLAVWLAGQRVEGPPDPNPLVGSWQVEDAPGLIVFTESDFAWYEDGAEPDRNVYSGEYSLARGALTTDGYTLSTGPGRASYSVFQHYTAENVDGVSRAVNYYGLFLLEHLVEADALLIANQRTGGRFTATRVG